MIYQLKFLYPILQSAVNQNFDQKYTLTFVSRFGNCASNYK